IGGDRAVVSLALASDVGARELQHHALDRLFARLHYAVIVVVHVDIASQSWRIVGFNGIHLIEEAQQLIVERENSSLRLVRAIESRKRVVDLLVDLGQRDAGSLLVLEMGLMISEGEHRGPRLENDKLVSIPDPVARRAAAGPIVLENEVLCRIVDSRLTLGRTAVGKDEIDREARRVLVLLTAREAAETTNAITYIGINRSVRRRLDDCRIEAVRGCKHVEQVEVALLAGRIDPVDLHVLWIDIRIAVDFK